MMVNGARIVEELQRFILKIDSTPFYKSIVDEDFFKYVAELKKGEIKVR